MSFDWNHARTFLSVAEEGSLSAAARKLGQTQPTVSRQIAGNVVREARRRALRFLSARADPYN